MSTRDADQEIELIRQFSAQNDGSGMHEHVCIRALLRQLDQNTLRLAEFKSSLEAIAGMTDFAPSNLLRAPYEMQQIAIKALRNAQAADYRRRVCSGPTGEWP